MSEVLSDKLIEAFLFSPFEVDFYEGDTLVWSSDERRVFFNLNNKITLKIRRDYEKRRIYLEIRPQYNFRFDTIVFRFKDIGQAFTYKFSRTILFLGEFLHVLALDCKPLEDKVNV